MTMLRDGEGAFQPSHQRWDELWSSAISTWATSDSARRPSAQPSRSTPNLRAPSIEKDTELSVTNRALNERLKALLNGS